MGRPFVGPAGELLNDVASYGGFVRGHDMNITNVVDERPPFDDFKKHDILDVMRCRRDLDALVKQLRPSLIITMGNEAAYHFVPDWPTQGRDIFGAKGIEDRRGYFWETKYGWVYTILHPAGAARKIVPGYELLRRDCKRAKTWLQGKLPRTEFPKVRVLDDRSHGRFRVFDMIGADIESRFGKPFCCGFTGDDLQPFCALTGKPESDRAMRRLLGMPDAHGVFHNGPYDADILDRNGYPTTLYTDDTQSMWGNGLEPELAFKDDEEQGKLTRKGLASLASLCPTLNVPFWKQMWTRLGHPDWIAGYPPEDSNDPEDLAKLFLMGGRDSFITRWLYNWLYPELVRLRREAQYRLAFETNLRCITMTRRGWRVHDGLRLERILILSQRSDEAKAIAQKAGLAYIEKHAIEDFKVTKQCECCHGVGNRCWRCAGLPAMPKKKEQYLGAECGVEYANARGIHTSYIIDQHRLDTLTVKELKACLPPCRQCNAVGSKSHYEFNPYSRDQLATLLYDHIGAPKWVFKGKTKMDEMAHLKLLQWAEA